MHREPIMKSLLIILSLFSSITFAVEEFKIEAVLNKYQCAQGEHKAIELRRDGIKRGDFTSHFLGRSAQNEVLHISVVGGQELITFYTCLKQRNIKRNLKVVERIIYKDSKSCSKVGEVSQGAFMIDRHYAKFIPLNSYLDANILCTKKERELQALSFQKTNYNANSKPNIPVRLGPSRDISSSVTF